MPEYATEPQEEDETEAPSSLVKYLDQGNIVDELSDDSHIPNQKATADALELYGLAKESMKPWLKKYKRALNLAKLQPMAGDSEIEEKTFPFEGASLAMMPYILEAMLDFSSRAAGELVWTNSIIDARIYGKKSKEKEERAKRVSEYSNYQLTELIPDWRDNQDKGLLILAAPGTFYKKTYYDTDIQEVRSDLCLADEIVFDHGYKTFDSAPDKFHPVKYTRNEVIGNIRGDQKWLIDEDELDKDEPNFDFIESYIWIDLDDDGLEEPYIALIWEEKERIVSLYPYYDEDTITEKDGVVIKIEPVERFTQYRFLPDPEGGPMGLGWGILLGKMFDAINTNIRQLIDAGTLHAVSANSGLISQSLASGRGNAAQAGPIEIQLGQLTPVPNHGSGTLRDNIVQLPFSGPSQVLFQLVEYLIQSCRSMTNSAINVEAQPGEAAALYLARLQQGLKVPNSIIMRVYECARSEFGKIAALNFKHYDDSKYKRIIDENASMRADFDPKDCDIRMVADPSQGSDVERSQRATAILQEAKTQPAQVLNLREAYLQWLDVMKTPNIDDLAPEPDPNAVDPNQQLMIAQMQMEAEMRQRDQKLREGELRVKESKAAKEAAETMAELGLKADKTEAEITKIYSDALKNLVDAGIASGERAFEAAKKIETQFIDAKGGGNGQAQKNLPGPA